MDQKNYRIFSSKILLFGEYLVLHGAPTLSFPYTKYSLQRSKQYQSKNKYFFLQLLQYIDQNDRLRDKLSPQLKEEIHRGLHFESNIPVGYGLGSSGSLVAAIYDDFCIAKEQDLIQLKLDLASMESFFHSQSSGIDPLTSFLNKAILSHQHEIELLEDIDLGNFELYDSGIKRSAKEAIQHFNALSRDLHFKNSLSLLAEISNSMISKWRKKQSIHSEIEQYSKIQLEVFVDFIPEHVRKEWKRGIETEEFYMKLCGAGMGGMYLQYKSKL